MVLDQNSHASQAVLVRDIGLKRSGLQHINTQVISEAIQRRLYLLDLIKIRKLTNVCAEQRQNYDPQYPAFFYDISN